MARKCLSAEQIRAASAVASGQPTDEIARAIGCNPRTIDRWKAIEAFQAEVDRIRKSEPRAFLSEAYDDRIMRLGTKALDALEELIDDSSQSPASRMKAISEALKLARDEDSYLARIWLRKRREANAPRKAKDEGKAIENLNVAIAKAEKRKALEFEATMAGLNLRDFGL